MEAGGKIATMVSAPKATVILSSIIAVYSASAFTTAPLKNNALNSKTPTQLDMFGNGFKNAFANDDSLGKRENAGLKKVRIWCCSSFSSSWLYVLNPSIF